MIGFSNSNGTWQFNDLNNVLGQRLQGTQGVPNEIQRNVQNLPFGSRYDDLRGASGTALTQLTHSWNDIQAAIINLATMTRTPTLRTRPCQDIARALMLMIQFVAEAARFRTVAAEIRENLNTLRYNGGFPPTFVDLETDWRRLSRDFLRVLRDGISISIPGRRQRTNDTAVIQHHVRILYGAPDKGPRPLGPGRFGDEL